MITLSNTLVFSGSGTTLDMDNLASRLKRAREARGYLSQGDLAKAAGLAQSTIGNIEGGRRFGASSLAQIAHTLGVDYQWLRDGEGDMNSAIKAWPLSQELLTALLKADPQMRRRVENAGRAVLGLEPITVEPADQQPQSSNSEPNQVPTPNASLRQPADSAWSRQFLDALQPSQPLAPSAPAAEPTAVQRGGRKKRDAAS